MDELELKKPIGDFIIKNAKGTQTENGVYYHYSKVCSLLKSYEKQLFIQRVNQQTEILNNFKKFAKIHENNGYSIDFLINTYLDII